MKLFGGKDIKNTFRRQIIFRFQGIQRIIILFHLYGCGTFNDVRCTLNVHNLAPGTYIAHEQTKAGISDVKFVVVRN